MAKDNDFDKSVDSLVAKGREQGFVTQEEILGKFPEVEDNIEKLDELYATLAEQGIDVMDNR